jgi:hypothetical protein
MFKTLELLLLFLSLIFQIHCKPSGCSFPLDIKQSRESRLHHPCEHNRNQLFAIETNKNEKFHCIYYSSAETSIFGSEKIELTIDGEFAVDEVSALDDFPITFKFYTLFSSLVQLLSQQMAQKYPSSCRSTT